MERIAIKRNLKGILRHCNSFFETEVTIGTKTINFPIQKTTFLLFIFYFAFPFNPTFENHPALFISILKRFTIYAKNKRERERKLENFHPRRFYSFFLYVFHPHCLLVGLVGGGKD